jgi:hypothetical protein
MKFLHVCLFLIAASILVSVIPAPAAAFPTAYTWHVQDTSGEPIKKATVDVVGRSGQMTDADGNAFFNFEADEFPFTVNVTAWNYDPATVTFEDPDVITMIVTLTGNGTPAVCGGVIMTCAAMLCLCLVVIQRKRCEDAKETR